DKSKEIHTNKAQEAIAPYSQSIEAGDFIYLSGAIPLDPETGEIAEGITNQTVQVMENLKAILTEARTDFSHVVKFTIYLASMEDFAPVRSEEHTSQLQSRSALVCRLLREKK